MYHGSIILPQFQISKAIALVRLNLHIENHIMSGGIQKPQIYNRNETNLYLVIYHQIKQNNHN